jgi:translation initiation factor 2 beta subunit (eIF-2beta)/eIF-5
MKSFKEIVNEARKPKNAPIIKAISRAFPDVPEEELQEDYFNVQYYNGNKNAVDDKFKNFKTKAEADKYAKKGNKLDRVGGEYKVFKIKGSMDENVVVENVRDIVKEARNDTSKYTDDKLKAVLKQLQGLDQGAPSTKFMLKKIEKEMKKRGLKEQLTESFMRLPGHVIGNELYSVKQAFESFYSSQKNGNDFNAKALNDIIKSLQSIKKEAKKFNKPEDVPVSYQYKK